MKRLFINLVLVNTLIVLTAVICPKCYAVVPASTSLDEHETAENPSEHRLAGIIEKLEQRHEEDIRFLESIKGELKELKE